MQSSIKFLLKNHSYPETKIDIPEKLEGWLTPNNQVILHKYLQKYTSNTGPHIVLELGVWLGLSTKFIYDNTPNDTIIISVDWWQGDTSIGFVDKIEDVDLYDQFIANLWNCRDRVFPIKMNGHDAIEYLAFNNIKVDLIYLDMGHSYKEVSNDLKKINKYYPKIPIIGDDFLYWNGTRRAVKEFIYNYNIPYLDSDANCYAILYEEPIYHNPKTMIKLNNYKNKELITSYFLRPHMTKNIYNFVIFTINVNDISEKNVIHININDKMNNKYILFNQLYKVYKEEYKDLDKAVLVFLDNKKDLKYFNFTKPNNIISITNNTNNVDFILDLGTLIMTEEMFQKIRGFPHLKSKHLTLYNYFIINTIRFENIILTRIFTSKITKKSEDDNDFKYYYTFMKNKKDVVPKYII